MAGVRSLACLLAALPAAAAELHIHFSALERMLAEQVFTQEGRRYVKGTKSDKCSFAYLEKPKIGGSTGRLRIDARFTGRSAGDLFGRCVGVGDSFELTIAAAPVYQDGFVKLQDVVVDSHGRDSFYIRRVRRALARSLAADFRYKINDDARRMLEQNLNGAPYRQELDRFQVSALRITDKAVVLVVDFQLAVK